LNTSLTTYDSKGTELFDISYYVDAWYTPRTITLNTSGTVYLRVTLYSRGNTGTFAIMYGTSNTRPKEVGTELMANTNIL